MFPLSLLVSVYDCLGALWTTLLVSLIIGYIFYVKKENEYFPKNGIKGYPSYVPFLGNTIRLVFQLENFLDFVVRMYKLFPEEKYYGLKNFSQRLIMVRDLEIIKQIAIKDFDYFVDHLGQIEANVDPLFGSTLVALKGQKWRDMRATLSPAFTSSKMRGMFDFVNECGDQMAKFFMKEFQKPQHRVNKVVEIEMKDIFTRYTNDVIATSAFGISVNTHEDRENEFYQMGKKATTLTAPQMIKFIGFITMPRVMKFFNIQVLNPKISQFFRNLVSSSMKMREEQHIIRPDMIHLLMEAKKGSLQHEEAKTDNETGFASVEESDMGKQIVKRDWTDDEIVAQAIIFFLAGFDTSSTLLSFLCYEIAKNSDIQKKLQQEIDEVAEKNNGKLKYDDLTHMKYMDMVVSETLRMWPPAVATDRKCQKAYTLPPSNYGQPGGKLKPGDGVWIPIYAIHHDPQYYKNPEKFDPERFSDENKHEIKPLAYLPFGIGPRNCIGSRFALMEVKSVVFNLLLHFDIVPVEKTPIPFNMKKASFNMIPKGGFWVGLSLRTKQGN